MTNMAARDAKNRFGEMLDNAQREPVIIEKHGRAVAVVVSAAEYQQIEKMRLDQLRLEVARGVAELDAGNTEDGPSAFARLRSELP